MLLPRRHTVGDLVRIEGKLDEESGAFVFVASQTGTIISLGPTFAAATGWARAEWIRKPFASLAHPDDLPKLTDMFRALLRTEGSSVGRGLRILSKSGRYLTVGELVMMPQVESGRVVGILGIARDITEYKLTREAVWQSRDRMKTIFGSSPNPIYITDLSGNIVECNQASVDIHGYSSKDELLNKSLLALVADKDRLKVKQSIRRCLGQGSTKNIEYALLTRNGDKLPAQLSLSTIEDPVHNIIGLVAATRDVTEDKQKQSKLFYMATHDVVTDLPNRTLLSDRLNLALHQARRNRERMAVILLDLDNFKDVNDTFGHRVGDKLLQAVGRRIRNLLRSGDTVARVGGDEFVLLLPRIGSRESAAIVAEKLLGAFREPLVVENQEIHITTSVGIAVYPDDAEDGDGLITCADIAMYRVKKEGRNNYHYYASAPGARGLGK